VRLEELRAHGDATGLSLGEPVHGREGYVAASTLRRGPDRKNGSTMKRRFTVELERTGKTATMPPDPMAQ
jgi:hypothetical protein